MKINDLETLVLSTLSFYEPMTLSKIILDFDDSKLKLYPQFDQAELARILKSLEKKGLIKASKEDKEMAWKRTMPKRSWWKRIFSFVKNAH